MERALGYDELAEEQELDRITRRLRRPVGRRRDASVVGSTQGCVATQGRVSYRCLSSGDSCLDVCG